MENTTRIWFNSKRVEYCRTSKIKKHRIETLMHSCSCSVFCFNNKSPNYTLKWSKDKIRLKKKQFPKSISCWIQYNISSSSGTYKQPDLRRCAVFVLGMSSRAMSRSGFCQRTMGNIYLRFQYKE